MKKQHYEYFDFLVKTYEEAEDIVNFAVENGYLLEEDREEALEENSLGGWCITVNNIFENVVEHIKENFVINHPIK